MLADSDFVRNLAVILAVVETTTPLVEIKKLAEVLPAATVTLDGVVAELELLLRLTGLPSLGAAVASVTVPVTIAAPFAELALSVRPDNVGGLTVREAFLPIFPILASISEVVGVATGFVDTMNVAEVEPGGTVTDGGTVTPS